MPKLDTRQLNKLQSEARRRARFTRKGAALLVPGGALYLPGTTGGRISKQYGRSVPRTQRMQQGSRSTDIGALMLAPELKGSGKIPSTQKSLKKIGEMKDARKMKDLSREMRQLDISKLSGGGGSRYAAADPLNKGQLKAVKEAAREGRPVPAFGGKIKDQEKLRKLILGGAKKPSKKAKAKKNKRSGGGVIYI